MEQLGTVETICRYPVKSMAGEDVAAAFAGFGGIMGDRVYAFVREGGTKGFPWLTAREREELVLYRPSFRAGAAADLPVDLEASLALGPGVSPIFPPETAFEVDVETSEGKTLPLRSPELAADLARKSGSAVTLRFSERSLADFEIVLGLILGLAGNESLFLEIDRPLIFLLGPRQIGARLALFGFRNRWVELHQRCTSGDALPLEKMNAADASGDLRAKGDRFVGAKAPHCRNPLGQR